MVCRGGVIVPTCVGLLEHCHHVSEEHTELLSALDLGVLGSDVLVVPERTTLPGEPTQTNISD